MENTFKSKSSFKCDFCGMTVSNKAKIVHITSHPNKILEWLFLGNYQNAQNIKDLKQIEVQTIINCAVECKNKFEDEFEYYKVSIADSITLKIDTFIENVIDFLEACREKGKKVLVHCMLGKSRSVTVIIAYLMKYHKMSYKEAYTLLKAARPIILPNLNFSRQLKLREYKNYITVKIANSAGKRCPSGKLRATGWPNIRH